MIKQSPVPAITPTPNTHTQDSVLSMGEEMGVGRAKEGPKAEEDEQPLGHQVCLGFFCRGGGSVGSRIRSSGRDGIVGTGPQELQHLLSY